MRKYKLPLFLCMLLLAGLSPAFAAASFDLLSGLGLPPARTVAVSTPTLSDDDAPRYEKPACVPSQALLPGRGFAPVVSDARRERAIEDLLAKIAVCTPLPFNNDGVVHTDPHQGLPGKPGGYYKEYTLIVPGRETGEGPEAVLIGGQTYMTGPVLSQRGPERLMIGGGREVYYTPDHYTTFVRLNIVR